MALTVGQMIGYSVLGSVGAYVVTSLVFLKFPLLLHKKKKRHFYCSHISHRGGSLKYILNKKTIYIYF